MKTLLRLIKRFALLLVSQANYPTPRERLWNLYTIGKCEGRREALKELPIVKVQPRQETEPLDLHLPPGELARQWHQTHREAHPSQPVYWPQPIESFPAWQSSKPPRKPEQEDPENTEEVPAIMKLKYATRKLE